MVGISREGIQEGRLALLLVLSFQCVVNDPDLHWFDVDDVSGFLRVECFTVQHGG